MATEFDADVVIEEVSRTLSAKFPEVDGARVRAVVQEEVDQLRTGTVTDYVSVLSTRAAKKRLKSES